jgi:hypothetical protein
VELSTRWGAAGEKRREREIGSCGRGEEEEEEEEEEELDR